VAEFVRERRRRDDMPVEIVFSVIAYDTRRSSARNGKNPGCFPTVCEIVRSRQSIASRASQNT